MTHVEYFRAFAAYTDADPVPANTPPVKDTAYYFEHNNQTLDVANLLQPDSSTDTQYKIFHYTSPNGIIAVTNDYGNVWAMKYIGELIILTPADLKVPPDVQKGNLVADGRFTKNIDPMIDQGGVIAEIRNYNNLSTNQYQLKIFPIEEIYGFLGMGGDGIKFRYELQIDHETPDNITERVL